MFFIYRIYCKIFHLDKEQQVNERFDEYLDELLRVNPGFFNKKIVKLLYGDYREIMDYRNNSYLYEKKIERIKKIGEKER